jgi:hypothetical protein
MPIIPRSKPKPLPPEGPAKLHVTDVTFGRSKEKKTAFFELTLLDLTSKLTLKDRIYLTEGSAWKSDAVCKSVGHVLPAGQYRLQIDDLVNRVIYGPVIHQVLPSGNIIGQMKSYWTREFAIQQDDKLADIPDPKGVLGPVELPLVEETPKEEPPPAAAKADPTNPAFWQSPSPSAPATALTPSDEALGGISDAELAEAFFYAKKIRAEKESQKKGE